jgi:alpha-galactosidase
VNVTWELTWFTEFPAVEWLLRFENAGLRAIALEDPASFHLTLHAPNAARPFIVHGAHGGRCERDDLMPFETHIGRDAALRSTELGVPDDADLDALTHPPSNTHLPFFGVDMPGHRGILLGLGTVGHWKARFDIDGQVLTARGLGDPIVLHPGQKARGHRVLLLLRHGERVHGHNMFRRLLYERYVPELRAKRPYPLVSINACFTHHGKGGFLEQVNEMNLIPLVDPFARLGAELFIIDAGWYTNEAWFRGIRGDWRPVVEKYPQGFRPIAERLCRNGMDFGLWFATARNLDRKRFLSQLEDLIRTQGMTCYRHDMNSHEEPLLDLWDEIRAKHTELVWEGCCGGGRNIDLEAVSRFHWHQKSDRWGDIESDQCSLYGGNLYLPGGLLNIPTYYTDDYGAWSSFAGQLCLGWHPLDEDFPFERARRQVELYKRVRPLLCGDFYPLTPCSLTDPWLGYQFHRIDLDAGFALLFRRDLPGDESFTVRLRGLKPTQEYRVCLVADNSIRSYSGDALAAKGLEVAPSTRPGAEMALYASAMCEDILKP